MPTAIPLLEVLPGFEQCITSDGGVYQKIHYYADPEKDDAWLERERKKMRTNPRMFRREILMDDTVSDGDPVFPEYIQKWHEVDRLLDATEEGTLFGGWDCGTTRNPAFVLAELTRKSKQARFLMEVTPKRPMAMETFAPIVRQRLKAYQPARWAEIQHLGDATVNTKSGAVERSAGEVARDYGFNIRPMTNSIDKRERAVIFLLCDVIEGDDGSKKPRAIYSVPGCPILVAGMRGAYCTTARKSGDAEGPGLEVIEAAKNMFSHTNDAHQYIAMAIERTIRTGGRPQRSRRY